MAEDLNELRTAIVNMTSNETSTSSTRSVEIVHMFVKQHGNGHRKPSMYLHGDGGQGTAELEAYDQRTLAALRTPPDVVLSVSNLFLAAEDECEGAYSSPDGKGSIIVIEKFHVIFL